jgi:ribonuclease T2
MAILQSLATAIKGSIQDAASASIPSPASDTMASSVPSLRSISKLAFGGAQVLLGGGQMVLGGTPQACSNPQLSCHNTTLVEDLCCFNAPGGQLLQTQFWDTQPVTGPDDSWTLHGLWYVSTSVSYWRGYKC